MSQTPDAKLIFLEAIEKALPEELARYLDDVCQGDAALRNRVEQLLQAHQNAGKFLGGSAIRGVTIDQPSLEKPGTVIGPYKLLQQIGEGGMGTVYMAEQTHPVQRKVALKVIKAGMDSRQVIARFEAERQALAMMDHANIARVLDAGATDSGRPYFVMELVHGVPITKYCDDNHLTPRERLELFVPVCQAIQHAHQKGIIHRDIKPSNVMVTLYDGKPVPKVIDFGVAKATEQKLTERTLFTQYGTMIGTLEYMSPEQAEMSALGVDTRSDIYSLGVLLYELLTGSTPLSSKRMKEAAYAEILRLIKEEEPPKPSTRLSDSGEALASISANRHTEPAKLTKLVRGELDWIVMKTLEKDRNRRYETAKDFAADVQRYLGDEPVQACPPSAMYRFRKFARRNKRALATMTVMAVAVLVTMVALTVSNVLIKSETAQKEEALKEKIGALAAAKASEKEAKVQEGLAKANADKAESERRTAMAQEKIAKQEELTARRRFYAAQMNLAMQAWDAGQRARALELLEGQRPRLDQQDLRTFEWYYLWQLCQRGCRRTLTGHNSGVVAYSPDGQTLATESHDWAVRLWHVSTGQERAVLRGHTSDLWDVAFSPDGQTLASASDDGIVKLWDVATGKERKTLRPGSGDTPVKSLAFTANGKTLATATLDIELWDVATGEQQATLRGRESLRESFSNVAFSPDAKTIAAGSSSMCVRLWTWDGAKWQEGATLLEHNWGSPVAFSPDGKTLATAANQIVKLWDVATGKERAGLRGHKDRIWSVAFSPDGKTLATGSTDRTVKLWDVATEHEVAEYAHLAHVLSVRFSPDGKQVASASGDGTVKAWDVAPSGEPDALQHVGGVSGLAFTPDSKTLLSGGGSPTQLWDVATGRGLPFKGYTGLVGAEGFAISADRKTLAARAPDKTVKLWDLATGQERSAFVGQVDLGAMALSPDSKTLAMWQPWSGGVKVKLWDVATGQPGNTLTGTDNISVLGVAFSPDGKTLAAGIQFWAVEVWDVANGRLKFTLGQTSRGLVAVQTVLFSPDGKLLVAGNNLGTVRLWDMETGRFRASFQGHTSTIRAMAFSPDGNTLATGSDDTTVKLWDVATGQERITLRGHKAALRSVAFAPDGNTLATGSVDGIVKLWRAATDPDALARKTGDDRDDPDGPLSWSRAGDQLRKTGRTEEAEEAYRRVIELYTKALALNGDIPSVWSNRGESYAKLGQWKEAAADFAKAVELNADDPLLRYRQALVSIQLGDVAGYRKLCTEMLAQSDAAAKTDSAQWTVWTCVLAADAVADWKVPLRLAEKAVADNSKSYLALNHHGAVLYRAGQYQKAIERLTEAEAAYQPDDQKLNAAAYNWLFLEMTHRRLGHVEQAKEWHDKAVQWIDQKMEKKPEEPAAANPLPWNRRLTLQLLRREAEELLKQK